MAAISSTRITAEEYFKLPETNQKVELINGEIIIEMPPIDDHQKVLALLHLLLAKLIPGGTLRFAPLGVHLDDENVPEPDLFWVSGPDSRCKLGEDRQWHGAPDLVIEVLSPSTARRDKREKYQLYEKHGTREYWLVEPLAQYLEQWVLVEGKFEYKGLFGPDDSFTSPVLNGQKVELKSVFPGSGDQG